MRITVGGTSLNPKKTSTRYVALSLLYPLPISETADRSPEPGLNIPSPSSFIFTNRVIFSPPSKLNKILISCSFKTLSCGTPKKGFFFQNLLH